MQKVKAPVRRDFGAVYQSSEPAMGELRGRGIKVLFSSRMKFIQWVSANLHPGLQGRGDRPDGQQQPLHAWKSEAGNTPAADEQPAQYREDLVAGALTLLDDFPSPPAAAQRRGWQSGG